MLITTLKPGQALAIGPDTTLQLIDINGRQTRLVIRAPKHIPILRDDAKRKKTTPQ